MSDREKNKPTSYDLGECRDQPVQYVKTGEATIRKNEGKRLHHWPEDATEKRKNVLEGTA